MRGWLKAFGFVLLVSLPWAALSGFVISPLLGEPDWWQVPNVLVGFAIGSVAIMYGMSRWVDF